MISVAYITCRKEPHVEWFLDSLCRECDGDFSDLQVIIIDRHYYSRRTQGETLPWFRAETLPKEFHYYHSPPKPCVWSGEHKLTKEDWFSPANSRNTALCLARGDFIAFCDDLSVLSSGWLNSVKEAKSKNQVYAGAYKKVKNLKVTNGVIENYTEFAGGIDDRWQYANGVLCEAEKGWLFGCSCAMPVEALLSINGWNEVADSIGMEDCTTGAVLVNSEYKMMYDKRMLTLESEEYHHLEPAMRREDWHFENGKPVIGGNGGDDCSHALLNIALGSKRFEYDVGGGFKDIRELRQHVLNGGAFPIRSAPLHHWFTKTLLSEL